MRLASVTTADGPRLHVRGSNGYVDVATATGDERLSDLTAVLAAGEDAMARVARGGPGPGRELDRGRVRTGVPGPRRVLCLGVNYVAHALEGGRRADQVAGVFVRGADSLLPPTAIWSNPV